MIDVSKDVDESCSEVVPTIAKGSRIPASLQAVFIASNRGEVVDKPPEGGIAFRLFGRPLRSIGRSVPNVSKSSSLPSSKKGIFFFSRNKRTTLVVQDGPSHYAPDSHIRTKGLFNVRPKSHSLATTSQSPSLKDDRIQPKLLTVSPDKSPSPTRYRSLRRSMNIFTRRKGATKAGKESNKSSSSSNIQIVIATNSTTIVDLDNHVRTPSVRTGVGRTKSTQSYSSANSFSERSNSPEHVRQYNFRLNEPETPPSGRSIVYVSSLNYDSSVTPQAFLDNLLASRGYSTKTYETLETGYHNDPTPLQEASFTTYIVNVAKHGNTKRLQRLLNCGISPNPSNYYGESLIHLVCRMGYHEVLSVMLECGAVVQVSDDFGRTPLHDACWGATPSFETVRLLIDVDVHLFFMTDNRGATPLAYVRREHYPEWVQFLFNVKDTYWPELPRKGKAPEAPERTRMSANSCPIPDPPNAMDTELARMVAMGQIDPDEARLLQLDDDDDDDSSSYDETESDEDDYDDIDEDPDNCQNEVPECDEDQDSRKSRIDFDEDIDEDIDEEFDDYIDEENEETEYTEEYLNERPRFRSLKDSVCGCESEHSMSMRFMENDDDLEEMLLRVAEAKARKKKQKQQKQLDMQR